MLAEEQLKVGDLEGAASRAAEQSDLGAKFELLSIISESRRVLAIVAARRGQHADAERLFEEAAAAQEVILGQLAGFLTAAEHLAFIRGEYARALAPLRQALRLARDGASGGAARRHRRPGRVWLALAPQYRRGTIRQERRR